MSAERASGIGERVKAARERLGWSREELAFHAGISFPAVSQTESGRRTNLRPATLSALAGALGVTIDYLVSGGPSTPMLEHRALLYESDAEFADATGEFLALGIERSEAALAVTTRSNIKLLRRALGRAARHVDFAESSRWYESPGAALVAYREYAEAKLNAGTPWIRVVGEPVWPGRSAREVRLWTRYESLLNLSFGSWPASLICPYDKRQIRPKVIEQAHLTHPQMIAGGSVAASADYIEPEGFTLEFGG